MKKFKLYMENSNKQPNVAPTMECEVKAINNNIGRYKKG